jgi:hypothetical protein
MYEDRESDIAADPVDPITSGEQGDQHVWRTYEEFDCLVVYHMKSGKTVSRKFRLPSTIAPAMMNKVIGTEQYRSRLGVTKIWLCIRLVCCFQ